MANKRICVQIDFDGPSPLIINSNGTYDKRTSLVNLSRLLRGIDQGAQFRPLVPSTVVVQSSLVQASATATCAAVAVNDTLSIGGTALTAKQGRANGTLTFASAIAGNTVVINGVTFTGASGAVTPGQATFSIDTSDTAAAASLAAQVAAYADPRLVGVIGITSAAAVATVYAKSIGTVGNAITLATTGGTITRSAATLTNGAALTNNQFDCIGSNTETATDIVRAAQASTSAAIKQANYSSASAVVTVTAKAPGVAGNAVTFTSSNGTRLAVTGSGFLASGSAGAPTQWKF
jgi:hypothetical protein